MREAVEEDVRRQMAWWALRRGLDRKLLEWERAARVARERAWDEALERRRREMWETVRRLEGGRVMGKGRPSPGWGEEMEARLAALEQVVLATLDPKARERHEQQVAENLKKLVDQT